MAHVWYVEYYDDATQIDVAAIYDDVLAKIREHDPDAYIEEIRIYRHELAFYVNHPTWTEARLAKEEAGFIATVALICFAIASVIASIGFFMSAYTNYLKETKTYVAKDPETGDIVEIQGWSNYLGWLAQHDPDAFAALKDYGATNWWEAISEWIPIVIILIGAAIVVPLIMRIIPKE